MPEALTSFPTPAGFGRLDRLNDFDLSTTDKWALGLVTLAVVGLGQLVAPLYIVIGGALGAIVCAQIARHSFATLLTYLLITLSLLFKGRTEGVTPFQTIVGLLSVGLFLVWTVRFGLIERRELMVHPNHRWYTLYMLWAAVVGVAGMVVWNNTANDWLREILIQLPLFLVPLLYVHAVKTPRHEMILLCLFFGVSLFAACYNIVTFTSNVAKAVYLYQMGRVGTELSSAILLVFVTTSFAAVSKSRLLRWASIGLFLLAWGLLGLSGYRTIWITILLILPVLYYMTARDTRKPIRGFLLKAGSVFGGGVLVGYLTVPLFRIFVLSNINRLTSSSELGSDKSLVNRYIEWGRLWDTIVDSPVVGFGYGAHFYNYDWLLGFSSWFGHSHNGHLLILFKAGIVGAVFFYTAYIGFLALGVRLSQRSTLGPAKLAIVRSIVAFMIAVLIISMTLNGFNERSCMLWMGLSWAVLISFDRQSTNARGVTE